MVALLAVVAAMLGMVLFAGAQANQSSPPSTSDIEAPSSSFHFPDGQAYVYDVEWRLFTAGQATLRIDKQGNEQHVHAEGSSAGAVSLLFHVNDRWDAYLDPATFCSSHIAKHIEEGFRRVENTTVFDYARKTAVLDQLNLRKGDRHKAEHSIPDCVTDVVSAIYYVSSLKLEPGSVHMFPLNDGGETVHVLVRAEEREEVKTPAGTFKTIRVQPTASTGVLKDRGKVWVWYSDDAQHIPVQMRARMGWGTLTFHLLRVEK